MDASVWTTPDPESIAPFLSTTWATIDAALDLAQVRAQDTVLDIGCGDGRVLVAHIKRGGSRAVGVELNSTALDIAREHINSALGSESESVDFVHGSFESVKLDSLPVAAGGRLVIFCFLLPEGLAKVASWVRAQHTLLLAQNRGSSIILCSLGWQLPGLPQQREAIVPGSGTAIYVYKLKDW